MPKKRTVRKDNLLKKLIEDEKDAEKKAQEKKKRKQEFQQERRDDLVKKLEELAKTMEQNPGQVADKSGDVDMRGPNKAKKGGVIKKIGKDKTKARANRTLLKVAKERGIIHDEELAKRLLSGKKIKNTCKPDGGELKRDKLLRKAREKRERRTGVVREEEEDEDDGASE
eukprot:CAMPEP_0206481164 /NCGR_PEP_ID=MMETSP0324_2-20121206/37955_1 /ASSEMBLY_ACC=CAM_ASM_000836 /TAXON_ID=2866 /ORGANISM="Crypthecodinium cohnii, Strain Seligo" /LENGTH=169 /DNA_ID=CAMNT_0053958547 /DNA_START=107 /DNA_END=616 /DNA_ORIENTATION=-